MSWSVAPTLPQRRTGPAWSTVAAPPARQIGTGWFNASAEKVAALSAHGTLSASIIISNRPVAGTFSGRGTLTAVVAAKQVPPGEFDSTGTLIADVVILRSITVNFSAGTDGLNVAVNEGLTAIIVGGAPLVDGLSATVVPGTVTYPDGLSAVVTAGAPPSQAVAANFSSSGALAPALISYQGAQGMLTATITTGVVSFPVAAALGGSGALTATVKPRHTVAAALAGVGTLSATVTTGAPVSFFDFPEGSGTTTTSSDSLHTLTISNATKGWNSGPGFLTFSATGTVGDTAVRSLSTWTFSVVVNIASGPSSDFTFAAHPGAFFMNMLSDGRLRLYTTGLGTITSTATMSFGAQHRVTVTSDGTTVREYVDGVQVLSVSGALPLDLLNASRVLEDWTGSVSPTAAMDSLTFWNVTLSAAEVAALDPSGISDDFNRADSTTSAGPNWTNRNNVVGIYGNNAYGDTPNSWNIASHNTPMGSDDMEASITLGTNTAAGGWDYVLVMVGCNTSGEGVFVFINASSSELIICNNTDWTVASYTVEATGSGVSWTVGTVFKVARVGNVYTAYFDGVSKVSWTDSGDSVPRDSSHRLVAFGTYNDANGCRFIDSFEAL